MKKIINFILFGLSFFAFILLMEFYISLAEIESKSNFSVDEVLGKSLRPNTKLCYFNEGYMMGNTNKFGYLGPSYVHEKQSGIFRIALYGDSFVESFQLFDRNSFRKVLEEKIKSETKKNTEVLNFGRSGFVMSDMFVYMRNFGDNFKPDLELVFLHNEDFYKKSYQSLLPDLSISGEELIIKNNFKNKPSYRTYQKTKIIRENSSFFRMLNNSLKLYDQNLHWSVILDKFYSLGKKNTSTGCPEETESSMVISEINQKILELWSKDPKLVIVLCDKPDKYVNEIISEKKLEYFELYKVLEETIKNGKNPFFWESTNKTGHWNIETHFLIGEYLSNSVLNLNAEKQE